MARPRVERAEMRRTSVLLGFILPSALLAGASCASRTTSGSGGIEHPTEASALIIKVETGGGFVGPSVQFSQFPAFALYGDGRVITEGPQTAIYPGPALPNLQVTKVTEDGIQAILQAAIDAGLTGPDRHFTTLTIADAPTTTFTVVANGERHVTSVYALNEATDSTQGIPQDELEARRAVSAFLSKLTDLPSWLPQGSVGESGAYSFDELRIFNMGESASPEPGLEEPPIDWPLPQPLATFGQPVSNGPLARCGSVSGSDLRTLLPLVEKANELTPWQSGGQSYSLVFRPLLPDESGCQGV